jgi:hypothetical protein
LAFKNLRSVAAFISMMGAGRIASISASLMGGAGTGGYVFASMIGGGSLLIMGGTSATDVGDAVVSTDLGDSTIASIRAVGGLNFMRGTNMVKTTLFNCNNGRRSYFVEKIR